MASPEARFFTLDELSKYDGSDTSLPIYICVQGMIFDVTPARSFYGPDGPYAVFAGKECARALARMSTSADDCTGSVADLSAKERGILRDWQQKFLGKYRVVGALQGAAWDTGLAQQARDNAAAAAAAEERAPKGHSGPVKAGLLAVAVTAVGLAVGVMQARQSA